MFTGLKVSNFNEGGKEVKKRTKHTSKGLAVFPLLVFLLQIESKSLWKTRERRGRGADLSVI